MTKYWLYFREQNFQYNLANLQATCKMTPGSWIGFRLFEVCRFFVNSFELPAGPARWQAALPLSRFTHCSSSFSPPRLTFYASEQDSAIISTAPSEVPGTERPLARRTNPRECFQPTQLLHPQAPLFLPFEK